MSTIFIHQVIWVRRGNDLSLMAPKLVAALDRLDSPIDSFDRSRGQLTQVCDDVMTIAFEAGVGCHHERW